MNLDLDDLLDLFDESIFDMICRKWKKVELATNDELETIIETILLEEEINND